MFSGKLQCFCWLEYPIRDLSEDCVSSAIPDFSGKNPRDCALIVALKQCDLSKQIDSSFIPRLGGGTILDARLSLIRNFSHVFHELLLSGEQPSGHTDLYPDCTPLGGAQLVWFAEN
jgi:hypothetical protein